MTTIRYKYTSIKDIKDNGEYNLYGIIYDASFPLFDEIDKVYISTIKIIDNDVNWLTYPNDLQDHLISLTIKCYEKETMPYIHSVGDIIRIHRGNFHKGKKKNMYLHMTGTKKSSWLIFSSSDKDYIPIACSSQTYTFETSDKGRIDSIRLWSYNYLRESNSLFYEKETKLIERMNLHPGDNDAVVQIVDKKESNEKIVFFVQDETDGCELHSYKYYSFLNINDVVRIRSFKVFDK